MTGFTAAAHGVDSRHFFQLAAGAGDQAVIEGLWRSERSWRLLLLRGLLDRCGAGEEWAGPLTTVDAAWDLLVAAQRADAAATEAVLALPQVGLWAAQTLRQVLRDEGFSAVPWSQLGCLHSIAAACAVRAGLSFAIEVPVVDGTVVLPSVGAASLPDAAVSARVERADGRLLVRAAGQTVRGSREDPRWHPPIVLHVHAEGIELRVQLLDRDQFRDLRGTAPPRPLTPPEIARWRADLTSAWALLVAEQPERARAIAANLRTLTPLPAREPYRQLSASGAEAFGGVLLSAPDDPVQLAMSLVHETQHHKLGALTHLLTLVNEESGVRYYAPWRDDPRPVAGLLQGTYAFVGITDFWRVHRRHAPPEQRPLAEFEFALSRRNTHRTLDLLAASGRLTGPGRQFVNGLRASLQAAMQEPVPTAAQARADDMAADHHAMWRGHNIRLDGPTRAAITAAWTRGAPFPSAAADAGLPMAVWATPKAGWFDTRAVLTRQRLARAAGLTTAVAARAAVTGASAADHALVAGERARARAGYREALRTDPRSLPHWIGLALAAEDRHAPATTALLHRPELVLAAVDALTGPLEDPEAMAAWVGAALPPDTAEQAGPTRWPVA